MERLESDYREMDWREGEMEGSQEPLVQQDRDTPLVNGRPGTSVTDMSRRKRKSRTPRGSVVKAVDVAWYVFDNLSCEQSEDLLRRHGENGTYLVAHFLDPESYGLSIKLVEDNDVIYKHYAIGISGNEFQVEGFSYSFSTIEALVVAVQNRMTPPIKLVPIFHSYNCQTCDYSISMSAEAPPDYSVARNFPDAAKKRLPLIVPIRPTLRRMMGGQGTLDASTAEQGVSGQHGEEEMHRNCCWKTFHTDPNGQWYKPHKAGPVTAVLLVLGWILFLLLFGWIVVLALMLVFILVLFAYLLNFLCTGRCQIEDDEDSEQSESHTHGG